MTHQEPRHKDVENEILNASDGQNENLTITKMKQMMGVDSSLISSKASSREDALKLLEVLQLKLEESQSKRFDIGPTRREIFAKVFDEVIHQTSNDCSPTALFLLRIRDEMKMTIAAWESLLDHGNNFTVHTSEPSLTPSRAEAEILIDEIKSLRKNLSDFNSFLRLVRFDQKIVHEHDEYARNAIITPLMGRHKVLKAHNRLLSNREDDGSSRT